MIGAIFADSSATVSSKASCLRVFAEVATSEARARYGEISAVLDVRRDEVALVVGVEGDIGDFPGDGNGS